MEEMHKAIRDKKIGDFNVNELDDLQPTMIDEDPIFKIVNGMEPDRKNFLQRNSGSEAEDIEGLTREEIMYRVCIRLAAVDVTKTLPLILFKNLKSKDNYYWCTKLLSGQTTELDEL